MSFFGFNPKTRALYMAVGFSVVLAACGSGGEEPLVLAMTDSMVTSSAGLTSDATEARCIAEASFQSLGGDRLAELGVTVESPDLTDATMSADEATTIVDRVYGCMDPRAAAIKGMAGGAEMTAEAAECAVDAMGPDTIRTLMIGEFSGSEPDLAPEMLSEIFACISPDS